MTQPAALFDLPDGAAQPPLSAGGRRRVRQAQAVRNGVHPLALVVTGITMHPDADRDATAKDKPDLPLRCGSCWHKGENRYGYPKCTLRSTRITNGDGTTLRAWWPACTDYSANEPKPSTEGATA